MYLWGLLLTGIIFNHTQVPHTRSADKAMVFRTAVEYVAFLRTQLPPEVRGGVVFLCVCLWCFGL